MKCLECGEEFTPLAVNQIYCSRRCGRTYWRKNREKMKYPSITFSCAQCGRTVVTEEGGKDKRTRFCSAQCEKKYWRHPRWDKASSNTNYHSIAEYAGWERRTNA